MRRSRNALWLLLAGLAGSLLAVRGVPVPLRVVPPQRVGTPQPQPSGLRAASLVAADLCSTWVMVNGPVAPLSQEAVTNGHEIAPAICRASPDSLPEGNGLPDEVISYPFLMCPRDCCRREAEPDPKSDLPDGDTLRGLLSGAGGGGDFAFLTAISQPSCDWAGLCQDPRHSVGAAEALRLNEQCDGIDDDPIDPARLDPIDLQLAVSPFSGPCPACVVTERDGVDREMQGRSIAAGAIFHCGLAIAKRLLASHEAAILATVRAARRWAVRAIVVGLTSPFAGPFRSVGLGLEAASSSAGAARM
jgi:hypothetical protein